MSRHSDEDVKAYGPWGWILGFALAGLLFTAMFGLSTGFL